MSEDRKARLARATWLAFGLSLATYVTLRGGIAPWLLVARVAAQVALRSVGLGDA